MMPRVSKAARPAPPVIAARSGDMRCHRSGAQAAASTDASPAIMAVMASSRRRTWLLLRIWTTVALGASSLTATARTAWRTARSVRSWDLGM